MPWLGGDNNHNGRLNTFQNESVVFSHELAETVTDPNGSSWRDFYKAIVGDYGPGGSNEIGALASNIDLGNDIEGVPGDFGMLHTDNGPVLVQYEWANEYTYPGTNLTVKEQPVLPR